MPKQLKRPNSTGSVYKLSGRRRKPWVAMLSKGYDKEGKRVRQAIGYYQTKTEALKALAIYDITPTERPNIKLCEVYEEWSASKYPKISKSHMSNYITSYRQLAPFHNKRFNDLRTVHFQEIIDRLNKTHKRATCEKIKSLANQLYRHAMKNDICHKNYAQFIELPPQGKVNHDKFLISDIIELFKHDDDDIIKIILCLVYTGFRPTALLSIPPEDYDAKNRILIGGIKTPAGIERPVPVHPDIQPYVDYFYSLNGKTIFCNRYGRAYELSNFRSRQYFPTLEKYGIKRVVPRDCRRTFASVTKMYGADETAIEKMMGHEDYKFTKRQYTDLEAQYLHEQINKVKIKE